MINLGILRRLALLCFGLLGNICTLSAVDGPVVFLSWETDPTSTMLIRWLDAPAAPNQIRWRRAGDAGWSTTNSTPPVPLDSNWHIRSVPLTNLKPATDYEFILFAQTNVFRFRTLPRDLSQPLRFVEGGDVYYTRETLDPMNALAAKFSPAFAVFGGDLAYSFTNATEVTGRWADYFDSWMRNAVTPDGRLVPMICTIGNHEVSGNSGKAPDNANSFYNLFPLPTRRGYAALDFGNYLSLILLDSGHTTPVDGEQTRWLAASLASRVRVPHVLPFYHVPAYPSFRADFQGWSGVISRQIQTNWCPVFDKFNLPLVFEHHDHTFKRTFPLRNSVVHKRGTVYLGDGCWAVTPRQPKMDLAGAYLAKSAAVRHFYVVTLYQDSRHVLAVDEGGNVFDEVYQRVGRR
jgi:hypothetical protein